MRKTDLVNNISTRLRLWDDNCLEDYGLYNGKTGLALAYFISSACLNNEHYKARAKSLMDELSENIQDVRGFDFENGLAGIGWAIEWLVQNRFIEANTDEVLEDMDDELYRSVVYSKSAGLSVRNGAIGKGLYFYRRLLSKNLQTSRYRSLCNQECLVFLIDEINDGLLNDHDHNIFNGSAQIYDIAQALLFLSHTNHTRINTQIVKRIICAVSVFLTRYFQSGEFNSGQHKAYDCYLIYAAAQAGIHLKDNHFITTAAKAYTLFKHHMGNSAPVSQFQYLIHYKLAGQFNVPLNLTNTVVEAPGRNTLGILQPLSFLPGASAYRWGEGWGL